MYKLEKKFKYKENYYKSGKMKEEEIEEIFSSNFNQDVELKDVVLNLNLYFLYNESWLLEALNYLSIA